MVQVMIRLQNHGNKRAPYWWLVIQPKNKHFQGRYIERVGIWAPRKTKTVDRMISLNSHKIRYWLSVGAQPTGAVHRILNFAGLLPKKPVPFGSKQMYPPKTKTYALQYFHKHRWGLQEHESANLHQYEKLKKMENLLKQKLAIDNFAINEIVRPKDLNSKYKTTGKTEFNSDMNTDEINSDDYDFYARKRNFDLISRKLNKYFESKYQLYRGNDYKYNNYLRKLDKLSKGESLDYEGFREYLNAVSELKNSKNKALENIANVFLNELRTKENFQKEIHELIKLAKNSNDKEDIENIEINTKDMENKNDHVGNIKNDMDILLTALNKGFEIAARDMFKVSNEETFSSSDFQDIKNLRIAKIMIKLRLQLFNRKYEDDQREGEGNNSKSFSGKKINKSINNENNGFFSTVFDNLKTSNETDIPLFDSEMLGEYLKTLELGNYQTDMIKNYDDQLFNNINKNLLSTETFQKFKPFLFHPEFYGSSNISNDSNDVNEDNTLFNPNIYLLNNDLIDELIHSLIHKLKRKYDINEIYEDESQDLNKFTTDEATRLKRRYEMDQKLSELKQKHGDFNLLYDDYRGSTEEMRKDIRDFKAQYSEDLEAKLDIKFKKEYREFKPELKRDKYDTQDDIEAFLAQEEKYEKIKKKIEQELNCMKKGEEYIPEEPLDELNDQEKRYEEGLRNELSRKILGPSDAFDSILPLPDDNRPIVSFEPYINMVRYKYKAEKKHEHQEAILKLNKQKLRYNKITLNSLQESMGLTMEKKEMMAKRFREYFGKYNSMMYAEGFRHLESYSVYNALYPTRGLADYQKEGIYYYMLFIIYYILYNKSIYNL